MNSTITLPRAELQAALDALLVLIGEEVYVAAHHVKVLAALHMALAKPASNDSQHLSNLLSRIHRDGGQYQGQHGTDKAVADADLIVARLYASEDKPVALTDAARYRWLLKNGFHYADNPNVSDYHKGGIHISGLYLESYDHEGLNAAIDAAIERAGEKK